MPLRLLKIKIIFTYKNYLVQNEALLKEEAKYAESFAKPALVFAGKSTISVRYDNLVEHRKEKWAAEKREICDLHGALRFGRQFQFYLIY